MTLASDTYFKKGVNIHVFIEQMQRNFILTDLMKTGENVLYEQFINMQSLKGQTFDCTSEYYMLQNFELDSYDRKFAIIDRSKMGEQHPSHNAEYRDELNRRKNLLHSQGFTFILATPWESKENIDALPLWPKQTNEILWSGGVSWFWFYMYNKHKDNKFNFTHDHNGSYWHKKHDFLYLNKQPRDHRVKLYKKLLDKGILENSVYTDWPKRKLPTDYELPWAQDYPQYGMDQDIYELPYIDTVCSIVSETNDNDYEVFMTEKIWKPIMAQHVFVVHGNYLYLQRLREMGFKTFGNYFDESYDLERDSDKRIDNIVSLCKDLRTKKWQDIYLQTKALREHNHDTMFNKEKLSLEINKTLNLFLEFADSR